jgi:hypothetical protein
MAKSAQERARFRERLGTYLIGVAIGCMIVGVLLMNRQRMAQREAARRAAQEPPASAPGAAPAR